MYMAYGWPQVIPLESGLCPTSSQQIVYLKVVDRLLLVVCPSHFELWSSSQSQDKVHIEKRRQRKYRRGGFIIGRRSNRGPIRRCREYNEAIALALLEFGLTPSKNGRIRKGLEKYEIPKDLYYFIEKEVALRKHMETHKNDNISNLRLMSYERRICFLANKYKKKECLPHRWKYDPVTASTIFFTEMRRLAQSRSGVTIAPKKKWCYSS